MDDTIFKIDVPAEIRKLTKNRFKSKNDWIVHILQFITFYLTTDLHITCKKNLIIFSVEQHIFDLSNLKLLINIFSKDISDDQKHRSIVKLETTEQFGILAAFAPEYRFIKISSNNLICRFTRNRDIKVEKSHSDNQFELCVKFNSDDYKQQIKLLENMSKHSSHNIFLNGKIISNGLTLDDVFLKQKIESSDFEALIGFPNDKNLLKITHLKNGIQTSSKYKTALNGLIYSAIINQTSQSSYEKILSKIRQAARLMYKQSVNIDTLDPSKKRRLAQLLFGRYKYTRNLESLQNQKIFELANGDFLNFDTIQSLAKTERLFALSPEADPIDFLTSGRIVLILPQTLRFLLESELNIQLTSPPVKSL